MVVLIDSLYHNTGASVLTYMLAKMYGNTMNQPCLFISLKTSRFFKSAISIDPHWDSQPASMVLNKIHGRNAFKPFCYKLEDTVYYYHAAVSSLTTQIGIRDIDLLIQKAQKDFGFVVVDIDSQSMGFTKLIPTATKILLSLPPDNYVIGETAEAIQNVKIKYEIDHGIQIKPEILYVINRYDTSMSLTSVANTLKTRPTNCFPVANSVTLATQKNLGRLDFFVADMLQPGVRDSGMKLLNTHLTKLLRRLKTLGGV